MSNLYLQRRGTRSIREASRLVPGLVEGDKLVDLVPLSAIPRARRVELRKKLRDIPEDGTASMAPITWTNTKTKLCDRDRDRPSS